MSKPGRNKIYTSINEVLRLESLVDNSDWFECNWTTAPKKTTPSTTTSQKPVPTYYSITFSSNNRRLKNEFFFETFQCVVKIMPQQLPVLFDRWIITRHFSEMDAIAISGLAHSSTSLFKFSVLLSTQAPPYLCK